eukprot:g17363.t1
MPVTVWENIRRWYNDFTHRPECPVRFGTVANDSGEEVAPTATRCVEVCFTISGDNTIYAAEFHIIDQNAVSTFPLLLGIPFIKSYRGVLNFEYDPPFMTLLGRRHLFAEQDTAMVEITVVPRDRALGRAVPAPGPKLWLNAASTVQTRITATAKLYLSMANSKKMQFAKVDYLEPSAPQIPVHVARQLEHLEPTWRPAIMQHVKEHEHNIFLLSGSDQEALSAEEEQLLEGLGEQEPEMMEEDVGGVAQQMHVTQEEYDYLVREHRRLGHSPAIVNLFTGPA